MFHNDEIAAIPVKTLKGVGQIVLREILHEADDS
jgi:hypothetical protein